MNGRKTSKMAPTDTWLSEFKTVENYGQDIMEKINERNKLRRNGGNYSKVQSDVRIMLKTFSRDISNLKQSLLRASSSYHVTEREIDRRQSLLDQLITKEKQMNAAFQQEAGQGDFGRSALLATDPRKPDSSNPFDEPEPDSNMSIDDMRKQQQQIISEQDQGLEALSGIIQRQKMIGYAITEEVDTQTEILDDIDGRMDQANTRLIKETHHIQRITAKSSTCGMLVVIVLLVIVIIVVAVVPKP